MKNPYQQVGERIRLIRRQKDLTQAQLAEKSGLSDNFIGLIERGAGHPTLQTLGQLAKALKVSLKELFAGSDEEPKDTQAVLRELKEMLENRDSKDAQLLLSICKMVFENSAAKRKK